MDRGTDATKVLTGQILKIKLGIVGVVNRSYEDIKNNVSIQASMNNETLFLLEKYPKIASRNGIPYLRTLLQKVLLEHIKMCLPPLQVSEIIAIHTHFYDDFAVIFYIRRHV